MKRGYGRCTRCGCYCHATYDDGKQFFEAPSGRQHAYQVTPPRLVSDCHNAEAQVWQDKLNNMAAAKRVELGGAAVNQ